MTLLPSVAKAAPSLLLTLSTGSLAILQPLPETTYRNLITLSNHLYSNLYHACGLNPKARRIVTHAPEPVVGGRVMVDGNVVRRLGELGTGKRADVMARLGTGAEEEIVRQEVREMEGGWCLF